MPPRPRRTFKLQLGNHEVRCADRADTPVDSRPGDYFVSAVDSGRLALVDGPYPSHREALGSVEEARRLAEEADPRAAFCGFGTVRLEPGSGLRGFIQQHGLRPAPYAPPVFSGIEGGERLL